MIWIKPKSVYSAEADRLGEESRDTLTVEGYDYLDMSVFRHTRGLQPYDLAVFGYALSMEGSDEQDWLVTDYTFGEATLVNSTPLLEDPGKFITPHLEKLLKRTGEIELAQLSIDSLIEYVFNKR